VARRLATRLGYSYLDTGALYRAVAWKVAASRVPLSDVAALEGLLSATRIVVEPSAAQPRVLVDGRDVTNGIRTPEISQLASVVSAIPLVRQWLVPVQRSVVSTDGLVAEGRDLGTKIFPAAPVKFFSEADTAVRAARRHREMAAAGHGGPMTQTEEDIRARDERDRSRATAPLVPASDAIVIDTTALDVDQVVDRMMAVIAARS
jgi:CMP/dCMP kinase